MVRFVACRCRPIGHVFRTPQPVVIIRGRPHHHPHRRCHRCPDHPPASPRVARQPPHRGGSRLADAAPRLLPAGSILPPRQTSAVFRGGPDSDLAPGPLISKVAPHNRVAHALFPDTFPCRCHSPVGAPTPPMDPDPCSPCPTPSSMGGPPRFGRPPPKRWPTRRPPPPAGLPGHYRSGGDPPPPAWRAAAGTRSSTARPRRGQSGCLRPHHAARGRLRPDRRLPCAHLGVLPSPLHP